MTAWEAREHGHATTCRSRSTRRRARRWRSSAPPPRTALREDLDEAGIEVQTERHVTAARTGSWSSSPGAGRSTPTASWRCRGRSGRAARASPTTRAASSAATATARSTAPRPSGRPATRSRSRSSRAASPPSRPIAVAEAIAARAGADVEPAAVPAGAARRAAHRPRPGVDAQARPTATARARRSGARCSGRRRRSPGATSRRTSPSSTDAAGARRAPQPDGQPVELDLEHAMPAAADALRAARSE